MYKMIVIGFSVGGLPLLGKIINSLPEEYPLPIAAVFHLPADKDTDFPYLLNKSSLLKVSIAADKEYIQKGHVYLAPPDYHLLIEKNRNSRFNFALSVDNPVKSVRPSIDVLFESAAEAFESSLISVLLCGANSDGSEGMSYVKKLGGLSIVLDPKDCEFNIISKDVIKRSEVDYIVSLDEIISLLLSVNE